MNDAELEQKIIEKGLTAPRVTLDALNDKIVDVEIVKHITKGGGILRWAVLTMRNGFAVTGKPSAAVSAENDNAEIGEEIAIENAKNEVWALEGYLLKDKLFCEEVK